MKKNNIIIDLRETEWWSGLDHIAPDEGQYRDLVNTLCIFGFHETLRISCVDGQLLPSYEALNCMELVGQKFGTA
jgi:hypothetical protein